MPWHGIASLSPSVVTFGIIQYYIIISLLACYCGIVRKVMETVEFLRYPFCCLFQLRQTRLCSLFRIGTKALRQVQWPLQARGHPDTQSICVDWWLLDWCAHSSDVATFPIIHYLPLYSSPPIAIGVLNT